MSGSTVTSLTTASTLTGAEVFYIAQGGADRKTTATAIAAFTGSGSGSGTFGSTVTNTYTASGTIAVGDSLALVNAASAASMTLDVGATDGHAIMVKRFGAGAVTLTATIDGGSGASIVMSSGSIKECVTLIWDAGDGTWLLV